MFYPKKTLFIVTKHNMHTHLLCVLILESEREWTRQRERERLELELENVILHTRIVV